MDFLHEHLAADVPSAYRLAVNDKRYVWALLARAPACSQDSMTLNASWSIVQKRLVCDIRKRNGRKKASIAAATFQLAELQRLQT